MITARFRPQVRGSGDRTETFQLKNGVTIKGGYAGFGEPDPDSRDINANATFLSGEIGDARTNSDNSYHVVTGSGTISTAVLDGFTVTAGNANGSSTNHRGGGMYNDAGSPTVVNCTFSENSASLGGGMHNEPGSSPTLTNCMFISNSTTDKGGGIYNDRSNPTLLDCVFTGNTSVSNGGALKLVSSDATITRCSFFGNMTLGGSSANGGAIDNSNSSPAINDCTFVNNSCAGFSGGAIVNYSGSNPTVVNCVFQGNSAGAGGGGIFNWVSSSPLIVNCIFTGNSANRGGGMTNNNDCHPTVINCTFVGNKAKAAGGGMWSRTGSSPALSNCILWVNTDNNGMNMDESAQVDYDGTGTVTVDYCDIQGLTRGLGGTGNVDDDPFLVDADGADDVIGTEDDNLRLLPGSPCIDAGYNSAIPQSVVVDPDGNPRIINGIVDMGAYEHETTWISVSGGQIDQRNLPPWTGGWTTAHGRKQSFTPDLPILTAIDIILVTANNRGGSTLTLEISQGDHVLATVSQWFFDGYEGLAHFSLPEPIAVSTSESVLISPFDSPTDTLGWKYSGNNYDGGVAYFSGLPREDRDFFFRTWGALVRALPDDGSYYPGNRR